MPSVSDYEACGGVRCIEMHGEGSRGIWTLKYSPSGEIIAVPVTDKEAKIIRNRGGCLLDREYFAHCRAHQVNKSPDPRAIKVVAPKGGTLYAFPLERERSDIKEWWDT